MAEGINIAITPKTSSTDRHKNSNFLKLSPTEWICEKLIYIFCHYYTLF